MLRSTVCKPGSMKLSRKRANNIVALHREPSRRDRAELAFLPAALEIVETPASPIGRSIGLTIIVLFCLALIWASLGKIDIVASAPGKIIPSERTKVIQPFESGVVRAIHVRDGSSVQAGQVLIELDPTMNQAELGHLQSDLVAAQLDVARLRAVLAAHADPGQDFSPPEAASPMLIEMQRQFLESQVAEHNSKLAEIDRQLQQKEAERGTVTASIGKFEAMIPLLEKRLEIRQYLIDRDLGSKITYLTELQDLVGQRHDLLVHKSRYQEADAAVAALRETRTKTVAEHRRGVFDELAKAEQKVASLSEDVVKAQQRTKLQRLTAPVDGVVQQLAVHTVGGVVTPGQALLVIVPINSHLEIEAMVSNRDIGFIHAGDEAEIKVDTFNFTRYGLLHGNVMSLSRDAVVRDKPQDKTGDKVQGAETGTSEPKGQELVYTALDRAQMKIEDNLVNLSPGMALTVEIKTGSRTVIGYLLSPLLRYSHDSLRER
jgi:membrane fusion protein, hemolysin D